MVRCPGDRRPARLARAATCSVGLLLALSAPGWAQADRLPCAIAAADSLSPSQQRSLRTFAREHAEAMSQGEGAEIDEARRSLLSPFDQCEGVTIGFRLAYGRELARDLRSLRDGPEAHRAVAALLIAGRIGTNEMIDVVRGGLDDARPGVRLAAAAAARTLVRSASPDPVRDRPAIDAMRAALEQLAQETDPRVATILSRAPGEAGGTPRHADAVREIARAMPEIVERFVPGGAGEPAERAAVLEALLIPGRDWLIQLDTGEQSAEVARATVNAAASAIAAAQRALPDALDADEPGDQIEAWARVVGIAESVMLLGVGLLEGDGEPARNTLAPAFEEAADTADPEPFDDAVFNWAARLDRAGLADAARALR